MYTKLMVNYKIFNGLPDICLECKSEHPFGLYTQKMRGNEIESELTTLINKMRIGPKPTQDDYDRFKVLIESERTEIRYKVIASDCHSASTAAEIQNALDNNQME